MSKSTPTTPKSWEDLLESVRDHEDELAGVALFRDRLANAHARAVTFQAVRTTLEGSARDARQNELAALSAGKDAAIALRGYIKSVLGTRNEKLLDYHMLPLGRPSRTRKKLRSAAARRKKRAAGSFVN
jgi:hypothetical protein